MLKKRRELKTWRGERDALALTRCERDSKMNCGLDAVTSGLLHGRGFVGLCDSNLCCGDVAPVPTVGGVAQVVRATVS